jgi:hypothetical protein
LRLLAVACCRRIWQFLADDASRLAVEVSERYADGEANLEELLAARVKAKAAYAPYFNQVSTLGSPSVEGVAALASVFATYRNHGYGQRTAGSAQTAVYWSSGGYHRRLIEDGTDLTEVPHSAEVAAQIALLRDLFGNPFRPISINPAWASWNGGTVPRMAQTIYHDRTFDRLPILADALEEAGCSEPTILAHCRSEGPHVRGCWVVDLILGKS